MNNIIVTETVFNKAHETRDKYPNMKEIEIAKFLFGMGYTEKILSKTTINNLLRANSFDEYKNWKRIDNKKQKEKQKEKKAQSLDAESLDDKPINQKNQANKSESSFTDTMLNEQYKMRHLLEAVFEEEKHISRLIELLIDLWRR